MDVLTILEKLQDMHLIRLHRVIGDYYQIYCPIHNDGNEKNPSCGVLLHEQIKNGKVYPEGFVHCFSCQLAMTLPELISELLKKKGISNKSGLDWLKENIPGFEEPEFDYLIPKDLVKKLNNKYAINYMYKLSKEKKNYVDPSELENYRFTVPYMYERKLNDEVISKFDVGVDLHYVPEGAKREVPCITFPVRDKSGNVLFIYRRSIKYKNFYMPEGLDKPVYGLYELPYDVESLIICESIFNALTCYVYGYPAVALLGTGTPAQINQLKLIGVKEFVLGLDPDPSGRKGQAKLKKALSSIAIVRTMSIPEGRDINDLDEDEFLNCYQTRI